MKKQQEDDASFAAVNEAPHMLESEKTVSINSVAHQLDDLGLIAPTEEEISTLRHVPDKINWPVYCKPSLIFLITPVCL